MVLVTGALAASFAIGMRVALGDVRAWWRELLGKFFEGSAVGDDLAIGPEVMDQAAAMMNAFMSGAWVMSVTIPLLLARWWQAILYNPGGFGTEFRAFRLPRILALPAALLSLYVSVQAMKNGPQGLAMDLLFVAIVMYLFQGLGVAHYYIRERQASVGWLVALYMTLIFVPAYAVLILATVGLADSGMDFRRLERSSG
jgi:hypothetical protein